MDLLNEHWEEHPEERIEIDRLIEKSERIEKERKERAKKEIDQVEYYRRLLNEE